MRAIWQFNRENGCSISCSNQAKHDTNLFLDNKKKKQKIQINYSLVAYRLKNVGVWGGRIKRSINQVALCEKCSCQKRMGVIYNYYLNNLFRKDNTFRTRVRVICMPSLCDREWFSSCQRNDFITCHFKLNICSVLLSTLYVSVLVLPSDFYQTYYHISCKFGKILPKCTISVC